jgi:hypothetical protein
MKVGILVVYFVTPENDWVLQKHLRHLAATSPGTDFRVYAAANRLSPRYRSLLCAYDFIRVIPLPSVRTRESAEHGTYLDMLVEYALADGCNYICTLDVDSWPIQPDWINIIEELLTKQNAVAASILRAENGDTVLPHPSFSFVRAELFRDKDCRFWTDENMRSNKFRNFLHMHKQFGDTGAALGFFLESRKLPWVRLLRSNRKNHHYLMAGIYENLIFHVGASSRGSLLFRGDCAGWAQAISTSINSTPLLWRLERPLLAPVKWRNRRAFDVIVNKLKLNEEALYEELLGQPRSRPQLA